MIKQADAKTEDNEKEILPLEQSEGNSLSWNQEFQPLQWWVVTSTKPFIITTM